MYKETKKSQFVGLALIISSLAGPSSAPAQTNATTLFFALQSRLEAISFPDHNLENDLRTLIGDKKITPTNQMYRQDVDWIPELIAGGHSITNITGLNYLTNLGTLYLGDNLISNLEPLRPLTKLNWLCLWDNSITDLSPLQNLANLESLYLQHNQATNIAPLAQLTDLTALALSDNLLSGPLPSLGALTNLHNLTVDQNALTDIDNISGLICLSNLDAQVNLIGPSLYLHDLPQLTELNIYDNRIANLEIIGLSNLTLLRSQQNGLTNFVFTGTTNIIWLFIGENQLSDISGLTNLPSLRQIYLSANKVTDLAALGNSPGLYYAELAALQVTDLTPLASLTNLHYLDLSSNSFETLDALVSNAAAGGLSHGATVILTGNTNLNSYAITTQIPLLRNGYGVNVVGP